MKFTRVTLRRIQNLESSLKCAAEILTMPDTPARQFLAEQFLQVTDRVAQKDASVELFDALACAETEHERIDALFGAPSSARGGSPQLGIFPLDPD